MISYEKIDIYKNMAYVVTAHPQGYRCGYVLVPKKHPYFKKDYFDMNIDCHGGLTFGNKLSNLGNGFAIGFDCNHLGDRMDKTIMSEKYIEIQKEFGEFNFYGLDIGRVRTLEYVETECKNIIEQLIKIDEECNNA